MKKHYFRCLDCGKEYEISYRKAKTFDGKRCDKCNSGMVVPDRKKKIK